MKDAYGFDEKAEAKRQRKLVRQSSRGSVRSSHSVQAPISRAGRHQPAQIGIMPSLKAAHAQQQKQNEVVILDEE